MTALLVPMYTSYEVAPATFPHLTVSFLDLVVSFVIPAFPRLVFAVAVTYLPYSQAVSPLLVYSSPVAALYSPAIPGSAESV